MLLVTANELRGAVKRWKGARGVGKLYNIWVLQNIAIKDKTQLYFFLTVRQRSVAYCNRKCQSSHYKIHRHECLLLSKGGKQDSNTKVMSASKMKKEISKSTLCRPTKEDKNILHSDTVCAFCRTIKDPQNELKKCTRCRWAWISYHCLLF